MPPAVERLAGSRFGLIADAHVHPGGSPPLPEQLTALFAGVDGILALGDLGEVSALDALERIAPVTGVLGVLLCAATHESCMAGACGILIINPGSPTLSDHPSVAVLHVAAGVARAEPLRL